MHMKEYVLQKILHEKPLVFLLLWFCIFVANLFEYAARTYIVDDILDRIDWPLADVVKLLGFSISQFPAQGVYWPMMSLNSEEDHVIKAEKKL